MPQAAIFVPAKCVDPVAGEAINRRHWRVNRTCPMDPRELEKALLDPQSVFRSPENVLSARDLTRDQKIEILRRWEYNAAEEAVALEEGMPGEESDLLRRILVALGEIAGPIDVEHTGPTKQHGLSREAVKSLRDTKD